MALAKAAAETATALATAKAQSDIVVAVMGTNIESIRADIKEIKEVLKNQPANFVSSGDWELHLKKDNDHEVRIREMEKFHDTLVGKMWGIGIAASLVMGALTVAANHYFK